MRRLTDIKMPERLTYFLVNRINATLLGSLCTPTAVRQERLGDVDARTTISYTHLITVDDVKVASQIRALLDKEFFAQDLPKLSPDRETASASRAKAV